MIKLGRILETTLYFTALINPFSKILFLTAQPALSKKDLLKISIRSNWIAWITLVVLIAIGDFLFREVFKVDIYSLNVAGGVVLFTLGFRVVNTGLFVKSSTILHHYEDIALVPLAIPLIVGPGIITAVITVAASHEVWVSFICMTLALLLNFIGMLLAPFIQRGLFRLHATEAFIRIIGLIIATMGVQMILIGVGNWLVKL